MLSILIIDDSDKKVAVLKAFFRGYECIKSDNVEIADSFVVAQDKLSQKRYDLVVVDLFLPREKGDEPDPNNGMLLLDLIRKDEDLKKPLHVVGLTGETYSQEHQYAFSQSMWFLLEFNETKNTWKGPLSNLMDYMINSKKGLQDMAAFDYDVAIVNALQIPEHKKLKQVFGENWQKVEFCGDDCTTYYETKLTTSKGTEIRIVSCFAQQMACTAMSMLTTKVIYNARPRYLFMTGILASVKNAKNGIGMGDIIVAENVFDGASGKIRDEQTRGNRTSSDDDGNLYFLPDYKQLATSPRFLAIVKEISQNTEVFQNIYENFGSDVGRPNTKLQVHIGPIASMPAVICSSQVINELKSHSRKLIGIEMESYGMYYAANNAISPRPEIVASIKSVSDFADENKEDLYQEYASFTSASFLKYLIENELNFN